MTMLPMLAAWLLVSSVAVAAQSPDSQAAIPRALRAHVAAESFKPIVTVGALPAGVRTALQDLFKNSALDLADPGAPFQATDVVMGKPLPWRRMIAAGCSSDHCVVYYERGGIAHVFQIVVFKLEGDKARFEFGGAAQAGLAGIDGVKTALANGSVLGQTQYF
jgi:hypothetical protein